MVKIYALKHPNTLKIKYIGKTERPLNIRLISHIYESKRAKKKTHKHNWILKCISENIRPEIILLEECEFEFWQECEKKWINQFGLNNLTNSTEGGLGGCGKMLSDNHKNNIRQALNAKIQNGEINYNERAKKISKAHRGKKLSEITKQKIRDINLGKKTSLETKQKLSKGGVLQYSLNGELIAEYISINEAAKAINAFAGNISWVCLGHKKTYKGFIWKYKSKDIVQS
jgi:hypothetical protein